MGGTTSRPKHRGPRIHTPAARALITFALSVVFVAILAAPAGAIGQPRNWRDGRGAGINYGVNRGWYVRSWQAILWSREDLCCQSDIDGVFAAATDRATKDWQRAHGLLDDGKVGYNTWNKAQHGRHYLRQYGETVPHMRFVKYMGANRLDEKWRFNESGKPRYISYFWSANLVCWFLGRTWNSSTDVTTIFNHRIVDDNPRCSGE
jgi:hypothetical protein